MPESTAAWIDAPYADLTVRSAPQPHPGPTQLVVRVRALALNPLDAIIQSNGRMMYRWLDYPAILGTDVAGEVIAVGDAVTRFAPGDRVVGYALGLEKGRDQVAEGGFRTHTVLEEGLSAPVPGQTAFEDVVALPLAVSTAAVALFQRDQLGLGHPLAHAVPRDETVVIWGGSTSVGSNAIQLAVAAGYDVVTTASPKNHALMHELGARAAVDYRASDAVAQVVAAVAGRRVAGVFAVPVGSGAPSVAVAAATGARRVALASPSVSFFDQPRRAGLSARRVRMLARLIGGTAGLQARARLAGIRPAFVWGSSLATNEVGPMLWRDHLPAALADGRHRALPRAEVVGTGLDAIQPALDRLRGGLSATKLVVLLP